MTEGARMLAIGIGPGPKNVLVELPDGSKTVVPYRVWKYQYAPLQKRSQLAEDTYRSFIGFVKFDPRDGEAGGKQIRSFVIRNVGVKEQAMDVRATLWPSHDHVELAQGDLVAVEGKFNVNKTKKDGEPITYFNLSVSNIVVLGEGDRGVREETANTGSSSDTDNDDEPY